MSKLDNVLAKAQKSMNLDIRSAREQCVEPGLVLDSPGFNYVLGGNLRLTRAYLIYGPFSQGKTSIFTYLASQIQKKRTDGKNKIVYLDMEYSLDLDHCKEMGLDVDNNFILLRPKSAEDIFNLIPELADSGEVGAIFLDSLTSLESKAQLEGDLGGFSGSKGAIIVSQGMKKIIPYIYNNQCPLFMIAQERQAIGQMYGPDFSIASCGKAPLFYSSWNARITRTEDIIDSATKEVIGLMIRVRNTKSKLDNPKRDANLKLLFNGGIDSEEEYIDYLVQLGLVEKKGGFYTNEEWGMKSVHGTEAMKQFLLEHPDIYEKVKKQVNDAICGHTVLDEVEDDGLIFDPNTGEILNPEILEEKYGAPIIEK